MMKRIVYFLLITPIIVLIGVVNVYANEYIYKLQKKLYDFGYLCDKQNITGFIDDNTEKAFENFKFKNDLTDIKIEDESSLQHFYTTYAIENTIDYSSEPSFVIKYQKLLKEKGFYDGELDGKYNIQFECAVMKYQKSMDQVIDGYITPITRYSLDFIGEPHTNYDIVKIARKRADCPYVLGAQGPLQYDCSGFMHWCLKQIGFQNKRLGTSQWKYVQDFKKIPNIDELKTGDLILWDSHMGIISGKNLFIDCSLSKKKVTERNLDEVKHLKFISGYRIFE